MLLEKYKKNTYWVKCKKILNNLISILLILAILNLSMSCSYYRVSKVPTTQENIAATIESFNSSKNYAIVHINDDSWHLKDLVLNEDNQTLSGVVIPVSQEHLYKKPRDSKRVHRYIEDKNNPFNEIHFHLKNDIEIIENSNIEIPFSYIDSISVNDKNTGRTVANIVLTTVGVLFVGLLLVFALKSSCPFIYIKNGEEYEFVGELYPGTITANMQRNDYLPIPNVKAGDQEYIIKIANYLKEIQYTDYIELISVKHDSTVEVLLDSRGNLQTFKEIKVPNKVLLDNGMSFVNPALEKDNVYYSFNSLFKDSDSKRNIVFEFNKPIYSKKAKLYLTAKNSVWLDYCFGKFNEQFGSYYNTFQKNQQNVSKDSIYNWTEKQNIPLSVYLKTNTGWELIEKLNTVGPMAMRNLVVPFDIDKHDLSKIEIKLETGFMFWEVDYVGIDFTENVELITDYISPSKAIDHTGKDVINLLLKSDNQYLIQPNIGDEVIVHFSLDSTNQSMTNSLFLKNRGYYNYIRNYSGIPDFDKLKSFRNENAFTLFSEKAYYDFVNFNVDEFEYHE